MKLKCEASCARQRATMGLGVLLGLTGNAMAANTAETSSTASTAAEAPRDVIDRVKFSGYIQGRFEYHEDAVEGVSAAGKPTETTQFLVRRARLKAKYDHTLAEFVLEIDATPKGVALKDAEATFVEPWTNLGLRLTVGQFRYPFGHEVQLSDRIRETPERSRVIRTLFPGERDRGLRLQAKWSVLRFEGAVVNGNGTEDPIYGASDQNHYKDVVGRAGCDLGWLAVGLSGYWGEGLLTKLGDAKTTPPTPATISRYRKARYGIDTQVRWKIHGVDFWDFKGELVGAKEPGDVDALGFYASTSMVVIPQGRVFLRVDRFDPDLARGDDAVLTIASGIDYTFGEHIKATVAYDFVLSEMVAGTSEPKDNVITVQLQAMF